MSVTDEFDCASRASAVGNSHDPVVCMCQSPLSVSTIVKYPAYSDMLACKKRSATDLLSDLGIMVWDESS